MKIADDEKVKKKTIPVFPKTKGLDIHSHRKGISITFQIFINKCS